MAGGRLWFALDLEADDGPVEDALQDAARHRLLSGDLDDLIPCLDELLTLDLTTRPDASVLLGRLLQRAVREPRRALAATLAARNQFGASGDLDGMALADGVLGDLAWQRGDVAEADSRWAAAIEHQTSGLSTAGLLTLRAAADFLTQGDVDRSIPRVHEAYAATVVDGSEVDEALATLLGGLLLLDTGDLTRAEDALNRSDDLFGEVEAERDAGMWPLVSVGLGEVAARRGDLDGAEVLFERGEHLAMSMARPALVAAARAMAIVQLSGLDPAGSLTRAQATLTYAIEHDVHWFARQLAERALAEAYLASGRLDDARTQAARCLETAANPLLRAKCQVLGARVSLARGEVDDAVAALDEATSAFLSSGTYLWAVESLLLLAEADPSRAPEYLGLAYDRTGSDVAFTRLWARRPAFEVTIAPDECSFVLGGVPLRLGDKGEQLVAEAVRAGEGGLHWEQAADALWSEDTDHDRIKSRLTSLTSLVRGRLGSEGWRLRRNGPLFVFLSYGADVTIKRPAGATSNGPFGTDSGDDLE